MPAELEVHALCYCAEVCLCVHGSFNQADTCLNIWPPTVDEVGRLLALLDALYARGFVHPAPSCTLRLDRTVFVARGGHMLRSWREFFSRWAVVHGVVLPTAVWRCDQC